MADDEYKQLLERLSNNEIRLGESISAITQSHMSLEGRVKALELAETSRAIIAAREDERDKALYSRLDRIERKVDALDGMGEKTADIRKDVDSIKGGFSKVQWAIALTIIGAFVAFIIKGGLNIH